MTKNSMDTTSNVLVERYLKGKEILSMRPDHRREEDFEFLQDWLSENIVLFRHIDKENLATIVTNVTFQSFFNGEYILEQEETAYNFYVVLRGSVSLLVDVNFQARSSTLDSLSASTKEAVAARRMSRAVNPKPMRKESSRHVHGKEVCRVTAGSYFGEDALLQKDEKSPYTARAVERTELIVINGYIFDICLHSYFQDCMTKKAEFLADLEWFRKWSPHVLRQLTFMVREKQYRFHECLYRQEMPASGIRFIQSGSVRISTHHKKQPPEELMEKIAPPKDFLPEILAEELEESTSKVSLFSRTSKPLSNTTVECYTPTSATSRYCSTISLNRAQTPVQQKQKRPKSTSATRKVKKAHKTVMGFIIHPPKPALNIDICLLGPGDTLCDIEAVCKLKKQLFNAVCESDVVIYELNSLYFELMFEQRMPNVLYQLTCRAKQRVDVWSEKHSKHSILFFEPLRKVLEQTEEKLIAGGAHRLGRKKPLYTPPMLAYTAITGLGKMPLPSSLPPTGEGESIQVPNVTEPSPAHLSPRSPKSPRSGGGALSAIVLSPFEPKIVDFEKLVSMMGASHPRFKSHFRHGKDSLFDSPLDTTRKPDRSQRKNAQSEPKEDSIPAPKSYAVKVAKKTASQSDSAKSKTPSPEISVTVETVSEGSKTSETSMTAGKKSPDFTGIRESLARANDPEILERIRTGLHFAKIKATENARQPSVPVPSTDCKTPQAFFTRQKWCSHSAKKPPASRPSRGVRPMTQGTYDILKVHDLKEGPQKGAAKATYMIDKELLTDIPEEYSGFLEEGKEREEGGKEEERSYEDCSVCSRRRNRSEADCPPFVKTMVQVIEDRTSQLLTKYRLSLAANSSTMVNTKYPKLLITKQMRRYPNSDLPRLPSASDGVSGFKRNFRPHLSMQQRHRALHHAIFSPARKLHRPSTRKRRGRRRQSQPKLFCRGRVGRGGEATTSLVQEVQ